MYVNFSAGVSFALFPSVQAYKSTRKCQQYVIVPFNRGGLSVTLDKLIQKVEKNKISFSLKLIYESYPIYPFQKLILTCKR